MFLFYQKMRVYGVFLLIIDKLISSMLQSSFIHLYLLIIHDPSIGHIIIPWIYCYYDLLLFVNSKKEIRFIG
jgi:hypothetical protein